MTNCGNCGVNVMKSPLHRVSQLGEVGLFLCMKCIEEKEPELAKNVKEDISSFEKLITKKSKK